VKRLPELTPTANVSATNPADHDLQLYYVPVGGQRGFGGLLSTLSVTTDNLGGRCGLIRGRYGLQMTSTRGGLLWPSKGPRRAQQASQLQTLGGGSNLAAAAHLNKKG
jgi:hypothetical protein